MATELVTFKMEEDFLGIVDETAKRAGFQNRTEFIRCALREKVEEVNLKRAMVELGKFRGSAPRNTTDKERKRIRKQVFEELEKQVK